MTVVAGIDVGTNSVVLTLARRAQSALEIVHQRCVVTRLGEGLGPSGELAVPAMDRTLAELERCADLLSTWDAPGRAAGTSALRRATNRNDFVRRAGAVLGFPLEVLTGEDEARLSYRGALVGLPLVENASPVVVDPGGGSTEVFFASDDVRSYEAGAVVLTEEFLRHDPPLDEEVANLRHRLRTLWRDLPSSTEEGPIVAVGGSVTILAAVKAGGLSETNWRRIHGSILTARDVRDIRQRLASMSPLERRQVPGLPPPRADIIVAGALLLEELLALLGCSELVVSDGGLRIGLLEELLDELDGRAR